MLVDVHAHGGDHGILYPKARESPLISPDLLGFKRNQKAVILFVPRDTFCENFIAEPFLVLEKKREILSDWREMP